MNPKDTAANQTAIVMLGEVPKMKEMLNGEYQAPFDYTSFREFAIKKFYIVESIMFHETLAKLGRDSTPQDFKNVISNFLVEGAEWELNIKMDMRKQVKEDLEKAINGDNFSVEKAVELLKPVYEHIVETLQTDVMPKYINVVTTKQRIQYSRSEALWFLKDKPFKNFFTFPNPIDRADSRLNNLCSACLAASAALLDYFYGFQWLGIYIIYSYIARVLCGPRLDIQSFVVLFLLRPLFSDIIPIFKTQFTPGPPRRFANVCGLCTAIAAFTLQLLNFKIASYATWGFLFMLAFVAGVFDKCAGCFVFGLLMKLGLVDKQVCEECNAKFCALNAEKVSRVSRNMLLSHGKLVTTTKHETKSKVGSNPDLRSTDGNLSVDIRSSRKQ